MDEVLKIVVQGRACRNTANIKNRQPLGRMYVKAAKELSSEYKEIIADELNVKEVIFTDDVADFTTYSFKPQLKTVGPKYGKLVGKIREALAAIDGNKAMNELKSGKPLTFDFDGEKVELLEEDLLIATEHKEGFVAESERDVTVVLDTNLSEELIEEGFVREIISKIQTMRKEADFEVQDYIHVTYHGNEKLAKIIERNKEEIAGEVLAEKISEGTMDGYSKDWNINGEAVQLTVQKA
ncbi:MAG: isoleucine--tRNA ligase, partial [Epulopiscium sp.]|nr:isoleucine--tRNA ligase [Candidatus Epulonipiscium sp.]